MAFDVSNLTDYTAPATEMLREKVLFTTNYEKYTYQQGISFKEYINSVDATITVQAGGCDLPDSTAAVLNEKVIEVGFYGINSKFCFDDLYKKAINMDNFEDVLVEDILAKIAKKLNSDFWFGSKAGSDLIDGIATQAIADGDVVDVNTATPIITTIITDVNTLISGMSDDMLSEYGELTIHTSPKFYNMYRQALILGNFYHTNAAELDANSMWVFGYEGKIKIAMEPGFVDTATMRMLLTPDSNIVVGVDEIQNVSSMKVVVDEVTDNVYFKSKFKFGVTYAFSDRVIVLIDTV